MHDPEALLLKLPAMHRQPANKMTPNQQILQQDSSPPGAPQQMMAAPMSHNGAGTPTQLPMKQEQPLMLQTDHSAASAMPLESTRKELANDLAGVFGLEEDGDDLLPIMFDNGSIETASWQALCTALLTVLHSQSACSMWLTPPRMQPSSLGLAAAGQSQTPFKARVCLLRPCRVHLRELSLLRSAGGTLAWAAQVCS